MVRGSSERIKLLLFASITAIIIVLDQLAKYFIAANEPHWSFWIFTITLVKNTGAGFGILEGYTFLLAIISALVALGIILFYHRLPEEKILQVLYAIFLGGVMGNLIDRVFRGYVIDFIGTSFWPAFNVADAAITTSVIGLVYYYWKEESHP